MMNEPSSCKGAALHEWVVVLTRVGMDMIELAGSCMGSWVWEG